MRTAILTGPKWDAQIVAVFEKEFLARKWKGIIQLNDPDSYVMNLDNIADRILKGWRFNPPCYTVNDYKSKIIAYFSSYELAQKFTLDTVTARYILPIDMEGFYECYNSD